MFVVLFIYQQKLFSKLVIVLCRIGDHKSDTKKFIFIVSQKNLRSQKVEI